MERTQTVLSQPGHGSFRPATNTEAVPIDGLATYEEGDAAASFDVLYLNDYERMVRLAFFLVGSLESAEELVQDAFVRVHQRWRTIASPEAYLRSAVVKCLSGPPPPAPPTTAIPPARRRRG